MKKGRNRRVEYKCLHYFFYLVVGCCSGCNSLLSHISWKLSCHMSFNPIQMDLPFLRLFNYSIQNVRSFLCSIVLDIDPVIGSSHFSQIHLYSIWFFVVPAAVDVVVVFLHFPPILFTCNQFVLQNKYFISTMCVCVCARVNLQPLALCVESIAIVAEAIWYRRSLLLSLAISYLIFINGLPFSYVRSSSNRSDKVVLYIYAYTVQANRKIVEIVSDAITSSSSLFRCELCHIQFIRLKLHSIVFCANNEIEKKIWQF